MSSSQDQPAVAIVELSNVVQSSTISSSSIVTSDSNKRPILLPSPLLPPPPRSELHPCSSAMKMHPISRRTESFTFSPIAYVKSKMNLITNNLDSDQDTDDTDDTDTDSSLSSSEDDAVYEIDVDDEDGMLNFVDYSGEQSVALGSPQHHQGHQHQHQQHDGGRSEESLHKSTGSRGNGQGKGKRKGRGSKGRGKHGQKNKSFTKRGSRNKNNKHSRHHAKQQSKQLKLRLYKKAEGASWDELSGNMKPRMGIKDVRPFAFEWNNYFKCSGLYSIIRLFIVLLLAIIGGYVQVLPIVLFASKSPTPRIREMILIGQWSVVTSFAIMMFSLNKWRFRGIGLIGLGMILGLSCQELLQPGHYCYSLLGGGGTIPLSSINNYTTALDIQSLEPFSQWSSTPKCHNMTLSQRQSEPFSWMVAPPPPPPPRGTLISSSSTSQSTSQSQEHSSSSSLWMAARRPVVFGHMSLPDVLVLSLHGLLRTSSTGLMLYLYGCGWLVMLSGSMMGPLYMLGKWLPTALQVCPSWGPSTENCVEEFLWGMYSWCCLVLVLMVFRGSKRNDTVRTNVGTFVVWNVWVTTADVVLLMSGILYYYSPRSLIDVANGVDENKQQGEFSLLATGSLTLLMHIIHVVRWLNYRCHTLYEKTEQTKRRSIEYVGIHPFLVTDDVAPPSCCTRCLKHFLCLADNVVESVILKGSSQYLHEQTPFRFLLVILSTITFCWTVCMVVLLVWQSQVREALL